MTKRLEPSAWPMLYHDPWPVAANNKAPEADLRGLH